MSLMMDSMKLSPTLFVAKGYQRIDFRRTQRRHQTRDESDAYQQCRHHRERDRIPCRNLEQQRRHHSCQRKGPDQTQHDAHECEHHALSHNELEYIGLAGTQRHAHSDLMCPLRDRVRHHAVDSRRCKHRRQRREQREQRGAVTLCGNRQVDPLVHRPDCRDRLFRINSVNFFAHATRNAERIRLCANNGVRKIRRDGRKIHRRNRWGLEGAVSNVADDAYDLVACVVAHGDDETFTDRFFVRKGRVDKLLTDDHDFVAFSYVLIGETPTPQERNAERVEVVLIYATKVGAERLVRRGYRTTFYCERYIVRLTAQWQLSD